MKKYYILILGLIILGQIPISAQKGTGGLQSNGPIKPIDVVPVVEEPPAPTGDRNIVWVHGFKGSSDSWNRYSDKFQYEYKMHCWRASYPDDQLISQAAQTVQSEVAFRGIAPNSNNIFIGHSMGGLVTREIDRQRTGSQQPELYGGFVTFSTPHKGAILAKSVLEGKADLFIDDGIKALISPFSSTFVGSLLINLAKVNDHIQLISFVFPKVGAAPQLASNSDFVRDLNYFNHSNKKIITVAARESGEKLWREVSSLALPHHAPSEIPFHSYADNDLPNIMHNLRGAYNGAGVVSGAIAAISALKFNFVSAFTWGVRSVNFFKGASWIKNAPKVWDDLVGANRTEQRQVTNRQLRQDILARFDLWQIRQHCERNPSLDCSFDRFMNTLSAADIDNLYETVTTTVTVPIVNEENDGIVLKSSSNGLDYANAKIETRLRTDLGVNHQECMNHEFITEIFTNDVFSGTREGFFLIAKR